MKMTTNGENRIYSITFHPFDGDTDYSVYPLVFENRDAFIEKLREIVTSYIEPSLTAFHVYTRIYFDTTGGFGEAHVIAAFTINDDIYAMPDAKCGEWKFRVSTRTIDDGGVSFPKCAMEMLEYQAIRDIVYTAITKALSETSVTQFRARENENTTKDILVAIPRKTEGEIRNDG